MNLFPSRFRLCCISTSRSTLTHSTRSTAYQHVLRRNANCDCICYRNVVNSGKCSLPSRWIIGECVLGCYPFSTPRRRKHVVYRFALSRTTATQQSKSSSTCGSHEMRSTGNAGTATTSSSSSGGSPISMLFAHTQRPSFPNSSDWPQSYVSSSSITATSIRGNITTITTIDIWARARMLCRSLVPTFVATMSENLPSQLAEREAQLHRLRSLGSVARSDRAHARGTRALDPEVRTVAAAPVLDTIRMSRRPVCRLRSVARGGHRTAHRDLASTSY
jgi:hypothetical protein